MRGGTYNEVNIRLDNSSDGTSGNPTTIASYPGEWAVIDASGLNIGGGHATATVFKGHDGWGQLEPDNYRSYWLFERFEVTGGYNGFMLKPFNVTWRYLYIHDNIRNPDDSIFSLTGGYIQ